MRLALGGEGHGMEWADEADGQGIQEGRGIRPGWEWGVHAEERSGRAGGGGRVRFLRFKVERVWLGKVGAVDEREVGDRQ
jgi:hypothetical protein